MKITKLLQQLHTDSGALVKNKTCNIDTPVTIDGRLAYRETYYLKFHFDEFADGIRIKDTSKISAEFSSYFLYLDDHDETFQTQAWQTGEDDQLVKIHLTHPWRLTKVISSYSNGIDVLRLDMDTPSIEPVIKTNTNTVIGTEFIGQDFALRRMPLYLSCGVNSATDDQAVAKQAAGKSKNQKTVASDLETGGIVSVDDMSIDELAVKKVDMKFISAHGIQWLRLKSYPTGPRIMLGEVNHPLSEDTRLNSLWIAPGEFTTPPVLLEQTNAHGIIEQLQTSIDRFIEKARQENTSPGDGIYIPITLESDTPAQFKLTDFEIHYTLIKKQWDHWTLKQKQAGKQALRFNGQSPQAHALKVNLPPGAQIEKAIIRINTATSTSSDFAASALNLNLNQTKGVNLATGDKAAKSITLDQAKQINKVAIAIMPVSERVSLKIQIVENHNGAPHGAMLAESQATISATNDRQWLIADLDQSLTLDMKSYWLTVASMEGNFIWLANDGTGKACRYENNRYSALNGVELLAELGLNSPTQEKQTPKNISLEIDGALNTFFVGELDISDVVSGSIPHSIKLVSAEKGNVTLYGPEIDYY